MREQRDDGSTIPLILGFFLIALIMVAASVSLGQAFVQQRDLQDVCDGAAAAAAASSADLDRESSVAGGSSLRFTNVGAGVEAYLRRDPSRTGVLVGVALSPDRERITLTCRQTRPLAFGKYFGRARVQHTTTSSARAAVVG
ncbi:pilus assembly protein TadG-related protein [uncultured Jatrophihabitans sp.]|uniref:pilus assembly protein TadG-related protein n=1 Tax=uncultured Jatrophihabitans sp. TaxID=1610747 RepID=UPI0035CAF9BE